MIFTRFGGFGTGESANAEQLKTYAKSAEEITVPQTAKVIALGEASHGNKEFQQLKLTVFKNPVENNGVRALAIEGDFAGCETVNSYIHGGEGTPQQAAAAIGFKIYQTEEMAELISCMRECNDKADDNDKLNFDGFDMERYNKSFALLLDFCEENGIDCTELKDLLSGDSWNDKYDNEQRKAVITEIKAELINKENAEKAVHAADMLLQYLEIQMTADQSVAIDLRDAFMAENVEWILEQEQALGREKIFVTGHTATSQSGAATTLWESSLKTA